MYQKRMLMRLSHDFILFECARLVHLQLFELSTRKFRVGMEQKCKFDKFEVTLSTISVQKLIEQNCSGKFMPSSDNLLQIL